MGRSRFGSRLTGIAPKRRKPKNIHNTTVTPNQNSLSLNNGGNPMLLLSIIAAAASLVHRFTNRNTNPTTTAPAGVEMTTTLEAATVAATPDSTVAPKITITTNESESDSDDSVNVIEATDAANPTSVDVVIEATDAANPTSVDVVIEATDAANTTSSADGVTETTDSAKPTSSADANNLPATPEEDKESISVRQILTSLLIISSIILTGLYLTIPSFAASVSALLTTMQTAFIATANGLLTSLPIIGSIVLTAIGVNSFGIVAAAAVGVFTIFAGLLVSAFIAGAIVTLFTKLDNYINQNVTTEEASAVTTPAVDTTVPHTAAAASTATATATATATTTASLVTPVYDASTQMATTAANTAANTADTTADLTAQVKL